MPRRRKAPVEAPVSVKSVKTVLVNNLKLIILIAVGVFSVIGTIGGGVLWIDNNYAHAGDVGKILQNQESQIKLYNQHQQQNLVFQLEYYDDRIRYLQRVKVQSVTIWSDPKVPRHIKAYTRSPDDIQAEINDLKNRRELIRRSIIAGRP